MSNQFNRSRKPACPHKRYREEIAQLITERIAKLPVDERGYPIPFFVKYIDGKPDLRIADGEKWKLCVKTNLCWVCGEPLGAFKSFVIGPMCIVNRVSGDPPAHLECAHFSARACPFLTKPQMVRREDERTKDQTASGGILIPRNPGVMALWTTKSYKVESDGMGGHVLRLADPDSISFWREARPATRAEIIESIETGLPKLEAMCANDRDRKHLKDQVKAALKYLPQK
jgi:hypothetical protein